MSKTIMAVDDAATMRKLIAFTLKAAGHSVLEAEDGVAALNVLSREKVDLVISDINMPRMNGIDLIRQLRQVPLHKATPILVVTTESDVGLKQKAKIAGANGWIVKPFRPEQLTEIVGRILGKV